MRPALRKEDFDLEKGVIIEEIAMYEDNPRYRVFEMLMTEHYGSHPLGNRVLGTPETITALARDDMQAYFDRRYSPGNMTLVGVGNVDFDAFVASANELCSAWVHYNVGRELTPHDYSGSVKVATDQKITREQIGFMSAAPSWQDEDRYAAQLAATVLGDSSGSRLYYALIDPAIADEAGVGYEPFDHAGGFFTFISTDAAKAAQARRIALAELQKFRDEGTNEQELLAAKNKIASASTLKGELPMGRFTSVGFQWLYCKDYIPLDEQIRRVFAVTPQQVADVVRKYDICKVTSLALGPLESI